ncbi:MAG: MFS transporter [Candidatus Bathyarchaeia archaeon]
MLKRVETFKDFFALERNIVVLGLTGFVANLASWSWLAFLPLYIQLLGADIVQLGIVLMVSTFVVYAMQLPGGILADRFGRKPLIIVGGLVTAVTWFFMGIVTDWVAIFPILIISNLAYALYYPAMNAMTADSVSETQRGTAFGLLYAFGSLPTALGPLIGGFLAPHNVISEYRPLFFWSAVILIICSLLRWVLLRETLEMRIMRVNGNFNFLFRGLLFALVVAGCLWTFGSWYMFQFSPVYAKLVLGLSNPEIGMMLFAGLIVGVFGPLFGKFSDRIGEKTCITLGWVLWAVTTVGWLFSTNASVAIAWYGVNGVVYTLQYVSTQALVMKLSPSRLRGRAIGVFSSITGVIGSIGILVGGKLWDVFGAVFSFLLCASLVLPATIILLFFVKRPSGSVFILNKSCDAYNGRG